MLTDSNKMLGAICGDICGSIYEWHNIKYKLKEDELITPLSQFTDDSIMTIAVAEGISTAFDEIGENWLNNADAENTIYNRVKNVMLEYARHYAWAGYGGGFRKWFMSENPQPYGSYGNGSAMRASYCGWAAKSLEEAEKLAEISSSITHNHPDGINGAKVVAASIFILRNGGDKTDVKEYVSKIYNIDFTIEDIREKYELDVSCKGSVPQGVVSFLEGEDFADVISNAISIGGDSDTIAAIAGGIAEAYYPIPEHLKLACEQRLENYLRLSLQKSIDRIS